jgi:hypothetical protein
MCSNLASQQQLPMFVKYRAVPLNLVSQHLLPMLCELSVSLIDVLKFSQSTSATNAL